MTTIYVDADGCPVKNEVYKVARRLAVPVRVVANSHMNVPENDLIRAVVVENTPEAADDWIAGEAGAGDVVITTDIPLADRCIKRGARVIDPRGGEFTPDSIGHAVAMRDLKNHLRAMDAIKGGPPPFDAKDRSRFLSRLDEVLQAIRRAEARASLK